MIAGDPIAAWLIAHGIDPEALLCAAAFSLLTTAGIWLAMAMTKGVPPAR